MSKKIKEDEVKNKRKIITPKRIVLLVLILIIIFVFVVIGIFITRKITGKREVISVNGISYTQDDYMMYLRLAKTLLFDENTTRLPKATLNTIIDVESNINTEAYLRSKTEENLKIAGAIEKIAAENNIELDENAYNELAKQKQDFIEKLGSDFAFKKYLYENRTTEEAYDKIARVNKLYDLVYDSLYAEGKKNDLSKKDKENAKMEYEMEYKKARQIFLVTVDTQTKKELASSIVEQKKLLANAIRAELNENSDFNEYIKKYSDDAINQEPPYDMYFKSGQLLKILEETIDELEVGQISDVIKSEYGYHIIKRDALDEGYLEKLYESKRENNFLTAIYDEIKDSKIIIQDSFTTIKVD